MISQTATYLCEVCKHPVDHGDRRPGLSRCCINCIKVIASNHPDRLQNDEATTQAPHPSDILSNQILKYVIDYINLTYGTIPCANCKSSTSEFWCNPCEKNYCDNCNQEVHRIRALENHEVLPLNQKPVPLMVCDSHKDERLKYLCQNCHEPVCSDCLLYLHKGHRYELIQLAVERLEEKIANDLSVIEGSIRDKSCKLGDSANKNEQTYDQSRQVIEQTLRDLRAAMDERERTLLNIIEQIETNNSDLLEQFQNEMEYERNRFDVQKRLLEILHSTKDPVKLLNAKQGFIDYINRKNKVLEKLNVPTLRHYTIDADSELSRVRDTINNCPRFVENLSQSSLIETYHNKKVERIVLDNENKKEWNFQTEILSENDMKLVAAELRNNYTLRILNLSEAQIDDAGMLHLANGLKQNTALRELHLYKNDISDVGMIHLADALGENTRLSIIDLSKNQIQDRGVGYFALMLRKNKTIVHLELSENIIGNEGAHGLGYALRTNKTLETLNLSRNRIKDQGAKYLAQAIRVNIKLAKLLLYWNEISNDGAAAFAVALRENKTLKTLYLSKNRIKSGGVQELANALKHNTGLTTLCLQENFIDEETEGYLKDIPRVNQNLIISW